MARPAATLAVVALLVVAGCAGFDVGTDPSGDSPPVEPVYEPPLDANAVLAGHLDAVREAGRYTLDLNVTYGDEGGGATGTDWTVWGNPNTGAMYAIVRQDSRTLQTYAFPNGTAYHRVVSDDEMWYREWTDRAGNASSWAENGVVLPLRLFEYSYAGAETVDGERVFVYEAEGAAALNTSARQLGYFDDVTVTSARSTLRVRADGLVTHATYEYTVEHETGVQTSSFTATFRNLGASDVSAPAWVSTARNRTADDSPDTTDPPTEQQTE